MQRHSLTVCSLTRRAPSVRRSPTSRSAI
jgi:hypothetical protein